VGKLGESGRCGVVLLYGGLGIAWFGQWRCGSRVEWDDVRVGGLMVRGMVCLCCQLMFVDGMFGRPLWGWEFLAWFDYYSRYVVLIVETGHWRGR
jgi:hypothetical protein